jgi:hypothetical protein
MLDEAVGRGPESSTPVLPSGGRVRISITKMYCARKASTLVAPISQNAAQPRL